ncbi:methyltransferase domain-containing protein [Polynucleobacter bastaniensis]|uniref:methyltransferase domain-containing protein n=1 Tax=Polynucleobacter bastaniensis TaxID=2081039 RepID=UPI001C0BC9C4|nr:methyltransferase domain-containing protein [Polynucleobacter bastaniensis]MBU3598265.1 methyltransferase domain-containing protein [Polynucleobacter bastaniensis]
MNKSEEKITGTYGDLTEIPDDWTFKNKSVADNFEKHVREQLPWYEMVTDMVAHFGRHYLPEKGIMYDLGASTGNITLSLKSEIEKRCVKAISVDYSEEMARIWRGVGELIVSDVREIEIENYDFCVCFLLIMFLPVSEQENFFQNLLSKMKKGGALIIFDKVEAVDGYLGTVMRRLTIAGKVSSGVNPKEIVKKEMSLAGQQRPLPNKFFEENTKGFKSEQIFRYGEFSGWVVIR